MNLVFIDLFIHLFFAKSLLHFYVNIFMHIPPKRRHIFIQMYKYAYWHDVNIWSTKFTKNQHSLIYIITTAFVIFITPLVSNSQHNYSPPSKIPNLNLEWLLGETSTSINSQPTAKNFNKKQLPMMHAINWHLHCCLSSKPRSRSVSLKSLTNVLRQPLTIRGAAPSQKRLARSTAFTHHKGMVLTKPSAKYK